MELNILALVTLQLLVIRDVRGWSMMPVANNPFACVDMIPCLDMTTDTAQNSSMPYEVELSTVAYTAGAQIKGMRIFKTRTTIYINTVRVKKSSSFIFCSFCKNQMHWKYVTPPHPPGAPMPSSFPRKWKPFPVIPKQSDIVCNHAKCCRHVSLSSFRYRIRK